MRNEAVACIELQKAMGNIVIMNFRWKEEF